jgi:hypothetical protein
VSGSIVLIVLSSFINRSLLGRKPPNLILQSKRLKSTRRKTKKNKEV